MTVLSVAYPLLPVTSDSAGGAEQILHLLDRAFVRRGIHSIVIGAQGSIVSGTLIETPTTSNQITDEVRLRSQKLYAEEIEKALELYPIDVVHFHGLDFETYLPLRPVPKLVTLHLPLSWYSNCLFDLSEVALVCVSRTQVESAPDRSRVRLVLNGIDTNQYRPAQGAKSALLWLGRVCPEKGVHIALRVAHRLDIPLTIAGPVHPFPTHEAYYREEVEPLLDDKRRHVGPVGLHDKATLLRQAKALLIPSLVAETSSLVAMEAACSGTPVVAFRSGALPEVVEDGVTGFVVENEDQMTDATLRINDISRSVCRQRALERFSADRMADDYVKLYRELLNA